MKEKAILMDQNTMNRALSRIAHEILERNKGVSQLYLVGIQRRGVPLAMRIADKIEQIEGHRPDVGILDITFYRDDLSMLAEHPVVNGTDMPFSVNDIKIVLVDDVLYTGTEGTEIIMMITIMDHDGAGTQALGYSTDEWCVAATTDVYTLTSDLAGVAAAPEPEPAADEVLQSQLDPMSELESELAAAAADAATVAPATADFSIAFAALGAASAALALAKKKRK